MVAVSRRLVVAGAVAVAAVAVGAAVVVGAQATTGDAPDAATTPSATATPAAGGFSAGGLQDPSGAVPASSLGEPVSISIPRLGVDSTLESLGIGSDGELGAPVDYDLAGWYADGVAPGEVGPAIIAGHVDSPTGPAIFQRIADLAPGDEIVVRMSSGDDLTFVVSGSAQSAKAEFPTDEVYSNVPRPELRLITCAGAFDRSIGHYTDNLIVFASLAP